MLSYKTQKKILIGTCVFIFVGIIAIAYAAFTGNININGTGINRKSNYDIYFNNVSNFLTSGTATVLPTTPTNKTHTTVIEDYSATLMTPGDSIYFTFDIVNDGDYDATLTSLTLGPVKCSVNGSESDPSATKVCSNIEYAMKYTDNNTNVSLNDTLASKETKSVKVTLTYNSNISASDLPTDNVTISNLGIDMVYEADSEAKTNSDGSTPFYTIGTELTIKNEKYNIVSIGEDYFTLLKQEPLTVEEVNLYGGVGTEDNHINKYVPSSVGTAYDANGYGGMAYYSSELCGYVNSKWINSECESEGATNYANSDIKYVVDAWVLDKFPNNELKEVEGYKARLINLHELQFTLDCIYKQSLNCMHSKYNWTRGYDYWTMTPASQPCMYIILELMGMQMEVMALGLVEIIISQSAQLLISINQQYKRNKLLCLFLYNLIINNRLNTMYPINIK